MSLIYGYDNNNSDGVIRTYDTRMTFTNYNDRKIVKVFNKGIVLLGIIGRSAQAVQPYAGILSYKFCSISGNNEIYEIRGKNFDYVALNEYSSDMVLSIKDIFTVPKACSITLELPPPNNNPSVKPLNPININITIQYIEFSSRDYGS